MQFISTGKELEPCGDASLLRDETKKEVLLVSARIWQGVRDFLRGAHQWGEAIVEDPGKNPKVLGLIACRESAGRTMEVQTRGVGNGLCLTIYPFGHMIGLWCCGV